MSDEPQTKAYYADLDSDLHIAKFPEDFADWLLDENREEDAKEFLSDIKLYKSVTDEDEWTLDDLIEIAQLQAPVVIIQEELRQPTYVEALRLLEAAEKADEPTSRDTPLRWDQEAALVNQAIADSSPPRDLEEPEYSDVTVWVDDDWSVPDIVVATVKALIEGHYSLGARDFVREMSFILNRHANQWDLFKLAWSYVTIRPEVSSDHERRFDAIFG
jgi:hypothetical protein